MFYSASELFIVTGSINNNSKDRWTVLAGWDTLALEITGSTNDDAREMAEQRAGEFVVWAKHQTAGRGREDRHWLGTEGCSLTFSVLIRPTEKEKEFINRFTALGALALTDLLKNEFKIEAEIKWPNDVLISGKKVSGILSEITWHGSEFDSLILGMGINLKDEAFAQGVELRHPATSLEAEGLKIVSTRDYLEKLLTSIRQRRQNLGTAQFIEDWNQKLAYRGKFMPIKQYQGKTEMLCPVSINADGSLLTRDQAGDWRIVQSAEFSSPSSSSGVSSSS